MVDSGMANTAEQDCTGILGIKLIPAGMPEPEKSRIQTVLDFLAETEKERDMWQGRAVDASDSLARVYSLLGVGDLIAASKEITSLQRASQKTEELSESDPAYVARMLDA